MHYVILISCFLSVIINALIYRRITATYMVGSLEEITPCCIAEEPPLPEEPTPLVTIPMVQEVYGGAWKNQTGIPWTPPAPLPEPVKPVVRGPLERPQGFV